MMTIRKSGGDDPITFFGYLGIGSEGQLDISTSN
jgi:hypothetical protein